MCVITPFSGYTGLQKSDENLAKPYTENYKVLLREIKEQLFKERLYQGQDLKNQKLTLKNVELYLLTIQKRIKQTFY